MKYYASYVSLHVPDCTNKGLQEVGEFFCEKIGSIYFVYLHVNESKKWESDNFLYLYASVCLDSWKYFYFHLLLYPQRGTFFKAGRRWKNQANSSLLMSWFSNKKASGTTNFNSLFALLVIRESLLWLYLKSLSKHLSLYYSPFCISVGRIGLN